VTEFYTSHDINATPALVPDYAHDNTETIHPKLAAYFDPRSTPAVTVVAISSPGKVLAEIMAKICAANPCLASS
jgi:acyl-CoA synthetase (AMP-forming)/AMP-acid ligase II